MTSPRMSAWCMLLARLLIDRWPGAGNFEEDPAVVEAEEKAAELQEA